MKVDKLTLFGGSSIVYKNLIIKQPKICDIANIGENEFYDCISYFTLDKTSMKITKDNKELYDKMPIPKLICALILQNPLVLVKYNTICFILFERMLRINEETLDLELIGAEDVFIITEEDWKEIVSIILQIFCLNSSVETKYDNTKSSAAQKLKNRFKEIEAKQASKSKKTDKRKNIIDQYCSILSTGNKISVSEILNTYTLYQLFDQIKRLGRYEEHHTQLNAMVHGAKIDKLTNWFDNLEEE